MVSRRASDIAKGCIGSHFAGDDGGGWDNPLEDRL